MTALEDNRYAGEKKPLILVVDDTPKNLQLMANVLERNTNYDVALAPGADRALKIISSVLPDLILLDVMMPEIDGYQLCTTLKESETTRDIPVIFITAKTGSSNIVKGFQTGAVDYISKPFNSMELLARVETHIELKLSREKLSNSLQRLQVANKEILEKNKNIEDSLNYAHLIQQAILPKRQDISSHFGESLVFFKPRDIVSGDFTWISKTDDRVIIAACDCIGHGVPGAFISILSYQLLHEIIVMKGITQPDTILNKLNSAIKKVFKQEHNEIYGGMDVALCSIDLKEKKLEFSGARSPLIYFTQKEFKEIKGDRFPIGGFQKKERKVFTKHELSITSPSMFYIFSDGFPDQLGGHKGHRFTNQRFYNLLEHIHRLPMDMQEENLEKNLEQWKGDQYDQIDDILLLGFKI